MHKSGFFDHILQKSTLLFRQRLFEHSTLIPISSAGADLFLDKKCMKLFADYVKILYANEDLEGCIAQQKT